MTASPDQWELLRLTKSQRDLASGFARRAAAIARRAAVAYGCFARYEELRSVAFAALSRAALTFDEKKGLFPSYAWRRVSGSVIDAIRSLRREEKSCSLSSSFEEATHVDDMGIGADEREEIAGIDATTGSSMEAFVVACMGADLGTDGETALLQREVYAAVRQAVDALQPDDRRLFVLRHCDELRWQEVALRLEISEGTARDRNRKIRDQLKNTLITAGFGH